MQESVFNEESLKLKEKDNELKEIILDDMFCKLSSIQAVGFENLIRTIEQIADKAQKKYKCTGELVKRAISELEETNYMLEHSVALLRETTLKEAIRLVLEKLPSEDITDESTNFLNLRAEVKTFEKEIEMKNELKIIIASPKGKRKVDEIQEETTKQPKFNLFSKLNISYEKIKLMKEKELQKQIPTLFNTQEVMESSMKSYKYYKSDLLNDLKVKLILIGKLTNFETQILSFVSHIVVNDLVNAKQNMTEYEGLISATEVIDLLQSAKIQN